MHLIMYFLLQRSVKFVQDVSQKNISPRQVDSGKSHRDQNGQNSQSESDQTGAGSLPAEGELLSADTCVNEQTKKNIYLHRS